MTAIFSCVASAFSCCFKKQKVDEDEMPQTVLQAGQIAQAVIPNRPVTEGAVSVVPLSERNVPFLQMTTEDDMASHQTMKQVAQVWRRQGKVNYLVYSTVNLEKAEQNYTLEMLPFSNQHSFKRELSLLWKTVFGAKSITAQKREQQQLSFAASSTGSSIVRREVLPDPFCDPERIRLQSVFEGETVRILYNYAPIDMGDKKALHFLVIPKEHRTNFDELKQEEYLEAQALTRQLILQFKQSGDAGFVIMYHKTGRPAGQTVGHWHNHIVLIPKEPDTICEKLNLIFRTVYRPKVSAKLLAERVAAHSKTLKILKEHVDYKSA